MTSSEDAAIAAVLQQHLAGLARPGKWSGAAVAVAGDQTGWWLSDATRSSAFHIGSVTKTMTALALAAATVAGKVALDDDLSRYLAPAAGSDVRLVDLATHTAGYPRLPRELIRRSLRRPRDPYSCITDAHVDRALARLTRARRGAERGYAYSNFGYGVLGRALTAGGDESFFDVLRAEVLDPLGFRETTLDVDQATSRVAGHDTTGRKVPDWHNAALAGCGCLWSTVDDLHRYLRANLQPEATTRATALRLVQEPRVAAGPGRQVGLGWHVSPAGRGSRHWHNGGTSGFGSFVGFNSSAAAGVAVMIGRAHGDDVDRAAMRALADLEAFAGGSGRLGP